MNDYQLLTNGGGSDLEKLIKTVSQVRRLVGLKASIEGLPNNVRDTLLQEYNKLLDFSSDAGCIPASRKNESVTVYTHDQKSCVTISGMEILTEVDADGDLHVSVTRLGSGKVIPVRDHYSISLLQLLDEDDASLQLK